MAKFILGVANRPPERAAQHSGGCAYMLLGVEPGGLYGVKPLDAAELDAGLRRYLGTQGPEWSYQVVPAGDVTVPVIIVEQTPLGRRPFVARGSFSGDKPEIQEGRIYVRRVASTEEASAAEIDEMLAERDRFHATVQPGWAIEVDVDSSMSPLPRVDLSAAEIQAWRTEEQRRLTRGLVQMDPATAQSVFGTYGDQRSRLEFMAEVDAYAGTSEEQLTNECLVMLAQSSQATAIIAVENQSEDGVPDLMLELSLPPGVRAVFDPTTVGSQERLPNPPLPYGQYRQGPWTTEPLPAEGDHQVGADYTDHEESGTAIVHFAPTDVRPTSRQRLRPFTVLVPSIYPAPTLEVLWRATSMERKGKAQGLIRLPLMERIIPFQEAIGSEGAQ